MSNEKTVGLSPNVMTVDAPSLADRTKHPQWAFVYKNEHGQWYARHRVDMATRIGERDSYETLVKHLWRLHDDIMVGVRPPPPPVGDWVWNPDHGGQWMPDTPAIETIHVDLEYPRVEGNPDRVTIELTDVRAADSLTVTYDFDRDGWVVLMDRTEDKGDFMDVVEEQVEVGFFPAWNTEG